VRVSDFVPGGVGVALASACVLLVPACRPARVVPETPEVAGPLVRLGPERLSVRYDDPRQADKEVLLARINRDRAAHGAPPVRYEPRAALVGDLFCLDAALKGSVGHWDIAGRPPYLRWALAGGVDHHSQNATAYSASSGRVDDPLSVMLHMHEEMMAEQPPHDGHRRLILDPAQTHVGIGLAVAGGELRMTQEFTRAVFEWIEIPAEPLRAGAWASFAGAVPSGWEIDVIEVRHAPFPSPLSRAETAARHGYAYPGVVKRYRQRLPDGSLYTAGGRGEFDFKQGRASLAFPLAQGPGHYYVLAYVRPIGYEGPVGPATAAMVTALP
jgi:uncharacterized protein YkwD